LSAKKEDVADPSDTQEAAGKQWRVRLKIWFFLFFPFYILTPLFPMYFAHSV
jgi:hypothetical protein